ncbi:DUF6081 family protein [Nocardia sp. NPDC057353]|uniref:DUF6081 family protein n=1 Tax=Nocardia sp. NPDC057353 TaxID=3346104 RepID=UPI0036262CD8
MSTAAGPTRTVWDDFSTGFAVDGQDARWFHYGFGPYVGDDAVVTTSAAGLTAVSSGRNADLGTPAFVRSLAQEAENGGLPGTLEHVKWLAFAEHESTHGFHGFDAVPGQVLAFESRFGGRTFGTGGHPFGELVEDSEDDLRLASVGMPLLDEETSVIFDFFLSNKRVYAVYERLPFTRGDEQGNFAAFVYQIPVADRSVADLHDFRIAYDPRAGAVSWQLDGTEVLRVDRIGYRLADREHLVVDHGGVETGVTPRQLNCGIGMFAALDYARLGAIAPVRLSGTEGYYYSTALGEPAPQRFLDDKSLESNRLFGQGAEVRVEHVTVSIESAPA